MDARIHARSARNASIASTACTVHTQARTHARTQGSSKPWWPGVRSRHSFFSQCPTLQTLRIQGALACWQVELTETQHSTENVLAVFSDGLAKLNDAPTIDGSLLKLAKSREQCECKQANPSLAPVDGMHAHSMQTRMRTRTKTRMHTRRHARAHTRMYAYTHGRTDARTHTQMCSSHACSPARNARSTHREHMHARMHAHIHMAPHGMARHSTSQLWSSLC